MAYIIRAVARGRVRVCHSPAPCTRLLSDLVTPKNLATTLPLDQELPGIPQLSPARSLPPPALRTTNLSSSLRVVSQETFSQVAAAALFIDAGSMFENDDTLGVCHFLEATAFRGSEQMSADAMSDFATSHGISTSAIFNREVLMYRVDFLRGKLSSAFSLLSQAALQPSFTPSLLAEAAYSIRYQKEDFAAQPQLIVSESLSAAAYGRDTPLGRPEKCPTERIDSMTVETLQQYHRTFYRPQRMVLSVVGVDHEEAVAAAQKYFGMLDDRAVSAGTPINESVYRRPVCPYIGGDVRSSPDWDAMPTTAAAENAKTEFTHSMLAFPTVGWSHDDVVPVCVVDVLLGGGSSFSAGGPGKGLYSRLYREVLNGHAWVEAANAFSTQLYDTGLVGVYGSAEPSHAGPLLKLLSQHLQRLTMERVAESELKRARNQLASSVMMNLETRGLLCEDIGRQILSHGKRLDPSELMKRIQSVTQEDVIRVVRHALINPPALAAVGDLSTIPEYNAVRASFEANATRFSARDPTLALGVKKASSWLA